MGRRRKEDAKRYVFKFRLDEDLIARLYDLAKKTGDSKAEIIRKAILVYTDMVEE